MELSTHQLLIDIVTCKIGKVEILIGQQEVESR